MACVAWGSFVRSERVLRAARLTLIGQLLAIGLPLLAGCSLAPFIAANSADYNETVESVTNSVLVTNILRARDGAPLYFSDLSQIRGSMQLSVAAQGNIPWGPHYVNSTTRGLGQGGPISANSSPTFDIAPLNTKQFAQGMLDAINVNIFSYFIQRGVNADLLLNLLVSRVEIYAKKNGAYRLVETYPEHRLPDLIKQWAADEARAPRMAITSRSSSVGPPASGGRIAEKDILAASLQANAAGLQLKQVGTNGYQLFKKSSHSVLCVPSRGGGFEAVGIATPSATQALTDPPIPESDTACIEGFRAGATSGGTSRSRRYVIVLRSVEAVFYYLGRVLHHSDSPAIPFYIYDHPIDDVRFHVEYRGERYYVKSFSQADYTIAILAILNDLLNLNRDANEIPTTRAVQSVP